MRVPNKIYTDWRMNYRHGDISAIARQTSIHRTKVADALGKAWADIETFKAVSKFYGKRMQELENTINDELPY